MASPGTIRAQSAAVVHPIFRCSEKARRSCRQPHEKAPSCGSQRGPTGIATAKRSLFQHWTIAPNSHEFPESFLDVYSLVTSMRCRSVTLEDGSSGVRSRRSVPVSTEVLHPGPHTPADVGGYCEMHAWALDSLRRRLMCRRMHFVAHIAGTPQIISLGPQRRYMVFQLEEIPGTVFHLRMRPKTLRRSRGDRVEINARLTGDATAFVDSVRSYSDLEVVRRANGGEGH